MDVLSIRQGIEKSGRAFKIIRDWPGSFLLASFAIPFKVEGEAFGKYPPSTLPSIRCWGRLTDMDSDTWAAMSARRIQAQ